MTRGSTTEQKLSEHKWRNVFWARLWQGELCSESVRCVTREVPAKILSAELEDLTYLATSRTSVQVKFFPPHPQGVLFDPCVYDGV